MGEMRSRCLACQYIRDGLPPQVACPECGEPAPPSEWIVLHGKSFTSDPRWHLLGCACMFLGAGILAYTAWRTGQPTLFVQVAMLLGFGSFFGLRLLRMRGRAAEGGDLCWVIKPGSIEFRGPFGTKDVPFGQLQWALYERGWARHYACLSVTPRSQIDMTLISGIWVDQRDVDARALHALLRQRIAEASDATSAPPPG